MNTEISNQEGARYYRTVVQVEVLSDFPGVGDLDLGTIAREIVHGECSGKVAVVSQQVLSKHQMARALVRQGSDPDFMGLDSALNNDAGALGTYVVDVCRTGFRHASLALTAGSHDEAEKLAIEAAASYGFGAERSAEYEVTGIRFDSAAKIAQPISAALLKPSVKAEAHSDDRVFVVSFDAAPWFARAEDEEIEALHACGWHYDSAADVVALHFEDVNEDIRAMLAYTRATSGMRWAVGFECSVNEEDADAWLKRHRPGLRAILLCVDRGVNLVEAQEPEVRGMWDWIGGGRACDISFDTKQEAALNAVQVLGLDTDQHPCRGVVCERQ